MRFPEWKDVSPVQFSILAGVALIGLLLRLAFPDLVGLTSDEIASLYFAENPGTIFATETHPPLFYLFLTPVSGWLDPYTIRILIAGLSFSLVTFSVFLSRRILSISGVCILAALLYLSPADIFFARTIRQYSLLLELTFLLILLDELGVKKRYRFLLSLILSGIHPLGWIPAASLGIMNWFRRKKFEETSIVYFLSCLPVTVYFVLKHF